MWDTDFRGGYQISCMPLHSAEDFKFQALRTACFQLLTSLEQVVIFRLMRPTDSQQVWYCLHVTSSWKQMRNNLLLTVCISLFTTVLHYQSFCDHSRDFAWVNSKFLMTNVRNFWGKWLIVKHRVSSRAANYSCRTSDNVRLNLANVRAKVILIRSQKKFVTLYIFLLWQNPIANSLNLHFAIKFTRHSSILLNIAPKWLYILVSWLIYISCNVYMSDQI